MIVNSDVLDAAICVLAGADFLRSRMMPLKDIKLARKEGWIWALAPSEPGR